MHLSREGSFISFSNFDNCSKLLSFQMLPKEIIAYLAISNSFFKELEIAKYAIFSLGSIWNDNSLEQLSKLENEIKDSFLLKCIKNQKLMSNQFLINK